MADKLFCFGFGYTASVVSLSLRDKGWQIAGTTTSVEKQKFLLRHGVEAHLFRRERPLADPHDTLKDVTHVLLSIPPDADGDPVFDAHAGDIAAMKNLKWLGYLSTTGVYGDQNGGWVSEKTPPAPTSRRGSLREHAEQMWQSTYLGEDLPLHIFRLAGIYGPGRSALRAFGALKNPAARFLRVVPTVQFDPATATGKVSVDIDPASFSSNDAERDSTASGKDWFDVATFPKITYTAEKFTKTDAGYVAHGTLKLKDMEYPLDLPFTLKLEDAGKTAVMDAQMMLDRSKLKLGLGEWADQSVIKNEVALKIHLTARH